MTAKTKDRAATRLLDLRNKASQLRMMNNDRGANEQLIILAIMRGESVVMNKEIKMAGKVYKPGEEVKPDPDNYGAFLKLAKQHGIVTRETWRDSLQFMQLKPVLAQCETTERELREWMRKRAEATARLSTLQSQIAAAEQDLRQAQDHEAKAEQELNKILDAANLDI